MLQALFISNKLKWLAFNQPNILGAHLFRGYPKMQDNKLVALEIIGWDINMPTNEQGCEVWEFIGMWALEQNITVQRSMDLKEIRDTARSNGFLKKFKYTFTNTKEWTKKLWSGYVYKLLCRREGDTLKIQKVIPYACPRRKPVKGQFNKKEVGSEEKGAGKKGKVKAQPAQEKTD